MDDIISRLKNEVLKRLENYLKSDEDHMNRLMDLEYEIKAIKQKRIKVQELITEVYDELSRIEQYEKEREMS